jgi:hypothetical protein
MRRRTHDAALRDAPPSPREVLELVAKARELLKRQRADPSLPHRGVAPVTGEVIDLLDGETDKLLDELERLALHRLGVRLPTGRA